MRELCYLENIVPTLSQQLLLDATNRKLVFYLSPRGRYEWPLIFPTQYPPGELVLIFAIPLCSIGRGVLIFSYRWKEETSHQGYTRKLLYTFLCDEVLGLM